MWALTGLGWYDRDVYDRVIARMLKFRSPDARANARTIYGACRALHFTPLMDSYAQAVSESKRFEGWAPHEQASFFHGWAMLRATGE